MKPMYRAVALMLAIMSLALVVPCRAADNTATIYQFKGDKDGKWPVAGLLEYQGSFYGTTYKGGDDGYGTAFKLTPPAKGKTAWAHTVLYSFTGHTDGWDGEYPMGGLIAGPGGVFYGTTNGGGLYGYGTAFKLVPPSDGENTWREVVIYDFCSQSDCADGTYPQDSLLLGADGALYGTASEGGLFVNKGTVFKLTPPPGVATKWAMTVLYSFCSVGASCSDGSHPLAAVIADKQGALYGTTQYGGDNDYGAAFKLTPPAKGKTDWTETVLYSFCNNVFLGVCNDGEYPVAALVFDLQGNLYGTTETGGIIHQAYSSGNGVVFKLTPPGNGNTGWTESVTHSFTSHERGANPVAALIVDSQNNLYGTTQYGGAGHPNKGFGTVFRLGPPHQDGTHRTFTSLTSFEPAEGPITNNHPDDSVILYQGALYGTTAYGGFNGPASCIDIQNAEPGCGSIFKIPLSSSVSGSPASGGGDPGGDGGGTGDPDGGSGENAPPPNIDPGSIKKIVQATAQKDGSKAVEFGIWQGDREILTAALGHSMTETPAATNMHYRIGGIAETFMSTLLLMLEEQGRIDLDQKISKWFPNLLGADRVTPRMLVANTAGYIDYVYVSDFGKLQEAQPFRTFTDDELINYSVRDGKMQFAPGTSQRYSHTDNVILGQVIQRATHESIAQLYEENIFRPMRMRDTYFPSNETIRGPVLHAFTSERSNLYEDCTYWNPSWGSTPGLPISNLHDIGKWGPILGTGRLISAAHFKEQIAPTSVGKGNNRPDLYFAYGFVVANGWIVQNPSINGYSGAFAYNLANGVTITVEATKSETATTEAAAFDILREVVKYVTPNSPINF